MMNRKKVLMICYYFPPIVTSGVARSFEFAKLLPNFGWEPLVLTVRHSKDPWVEASLGADPKGIRVERTLEWNLAGLADFLHGCCSRVARLFGKNLTHNLFREFLCIPDSQIAWFSTIRARRLARECELIYVSCSPFSSSVSGAIVKRLTGRPLVVDFRDAWSLNPYAHFGPLHRAIITWLERIVLSACDALIVNTDGAARLYATAYPEYREKIVTIPNGYDVLTPVARRPTEGDFQIMHVGSFYGSRNPDALLECLAEIKRDDIVFVQVGGGFDSYERFKKKVKIKIVPPVHREEALELMREASLLYLKQGWEAGVSEYIAVGAKTYEYLATGLPILAEVPPGDNAELVEKYASAGYTVTSNKRADLRHAVESAYAARSRANVAIHPEFAKKFSRRELTWQLATLFDRLTSPT
jgi:glycosyltransferase involved in cell wall biosynthesis